MCYERRYNKDQIFFFWFGYVFHLSRKGCCLKKTERKGKNKRIPQLAKNPATRLEKSGN